jgi:phosphatidylinositol glycan class W
MTYKHDKEAFVSNHDGTTFAEVSAVTMTLCLGILAREVVTRAHHRLSWRARVALDVVLVVAVSVLVYAHTPHLPLIVVTLSGVIVAAMAYHTTTITSHTTTATTTTPTSSILFCLPPLFDDDDDNDDLLDDALRRRRATAIADLNSPRPRAITYFRAAIMLATIVCILAVDFTVFPRRFCKTETFGSSVMDAGVGCFVVSAALSSRHLSRVNRLSSSSTSPSSSSSLPLSLLRLPLRLAARVARVAASAAPVFVLACVRLATVRAADYQTHLSGTYNSNLLFASFPRSPN